METFARTSTSSSSDSALSIHVTYGPSQSRETVPLTKKYRPYSNVQGEKQPIRKASREKNLIWLLGSKGKQR